MTQQTRVGPAPADVSIQLLGAFRVHVDGRTVEVGDWPARRASELVMLLALDPRHHLLRDQVLDALWPHLDPEAAPASLRKAAHHARRVLGDPDAVVLRGGMVLLFPNRSVRTDVKDFEAADPSHAAELYPGDLLPDARYEDWAAAPREELRARWLDALRRTAAWDRLAQEDPTDEEAARALMAAALATGTPHAAVRTYGRLRTALHDQVGARPSPHTQALYERCLTGLRRPERPMIGRHVELAEARAAVEDETATVLAVRGPGGIGKTTLCRELVTSHDGLVLTVRVTRDAGAYGPLATLADLLISTPHDPLSPHTVAVLDALLGTPRALPQQVTRHQVVGALRRLLSATRQKQRTVIVVDDAHLADDDSAEALVHLAGIGAVDAPLVVLAYRPEQAGAALVGGVARLARAQVARAVDLAALERHEAAALVHTGAPVPVDVPTMERILTAGDGNPFFLLELARHPQAVEQGRAGASWDAVSERFLDLDEATRDAVCRLAVAGEELSTAAAAAVTATTEEQAFTLLDRALAAEVLVVAGTRYRFRHELVRQALLDQLPPHRRAALHRDAAERLVGTDAAPEAIAAQWVAGGRSDRATDWLVRAAQHAVRLGAYGDALGHADTVLAHEPAHPQALCLRAEALEALGDERAPSAWGAAARHVPDDEHDDVVAKQALASLRAGAPADAAELLKGLQVRSLDGRLAQALALCGAAAMGFADPAVGVATAARTRRLAVAAGNPSAVVIAAWAEAAAAHANGDLPINLQAVLRDTASLPDQAITLFDGQLCVAERLLYGNRPYGEVIAFATDLGQQAERRGAGRGLAFATTFRGEAHLLSGRLDEAEADLARGVDLHRAIGAAGGEALSLQRLAEVALQRGDRERARELVDEALAVARESNLGFHLFDRIYGTRIALAPDPRSALAALEEAEDAVHGAMETCPGCRITLAVPAGIAAARAGDLERARHWEAVTEQLTGILMRLPGWYAALDELRGHRARAEGDPVGATGHFSSAAEWFRRAGHPLDAERCDLQAR